MIGDILGGRVRDYAPANAIEQENVLAELLQHYVLASLSRARFFSNACFHGGTCLRILYGMNRFSEDLDFLLREPDPGFDWAPHLDRIRRDCGDEGIEFEVQERARASSAVRTAWLRTDSIGREPVDLPFPRKSDRKIRIKLEIDRNPPRGSILETRYINFPLAAAITTQTLDSGFATKAHALLCREYTKGRDWYDFLWYVSKRAVPQYDLLANALDQQGPWARQGVRVTPDWFRAAMRDRIEEVDWEAARKDVSRFLVSSEQESVSLWKKEFFLYHLDRLMEHDESRQ